MSYDLHLFAIVGDETIEQALTRSSSESEEMNPGVPVPEKESLKRRLASALIKKNPALEPFEFGFEDIAKMLGTSEEEAKLRWRHIELNGPDDGNGIQITLFDDSASITIPYWHQGEKASAVFREVWEYIEVLQKEGGYLVYDAQLDRVVDRSSGIPEMLKAYARGTKVIDELTDGAAKARKPWWRFW